MGRLSGCSVEQLMQQLREDSGLVAEAVGELRDRGFRAVVESVFELSDHQYRELDTTMTDEFAAICRDACIMALEHEGSITYVEERHNPPNMRANVYCSYSGGIECGVRFEC